MSSGSNWGNIMEKCFRSAMDLLLNIFFPQSCLGCSRETRRDEVVCSSCFQKIQINKSLHCGKCKARLPEGKKICHPDFPYILGTAAEYQDKTVRSAVKALKFGFAKNAAQPLAKLIISLSENINLAEGGWLVIPIPLGKKRLRKRGFNQAELIAGIFAKHFSLEMEKSALIRSRETEPQSEIKNFELRFQNTDKCFGTACPEKLAGRNIILIDDVSTSGATFFEAAMSLKKSGAKKIIALAAAKG